MHLIAVLAGVRSLFRQRRRARSVRPVAAAGAGAARDSGIPRALDVLPVGRGHGRRQAGADPIGAQDDFEDGADGADGYDADGYGAEEYDADGDDADEYGGYEADDAAEAAADAPEAEDPDQVDTDLQQPPPAQRGRHMPSPRQRKQLREVSRILDGETERLNIARTTTEAAGALVEADVAALVVRSVEGPRVLWQDPGGSEPDDIWGPATLAALLTVGSPVREVIEGDPLIDYGSSALLVVPVPSAGTLVGALMARRQTPRSFSPAEEDALLRLARMAGAALDADSRRGHLDPSSGTDPVTRFWPRERLLHDLRAALRGTQQHSMPAALLLAEVTGLAERRRAAGPEAADRALAGLATGLPGCLRVGDVPYRFGHDELAVLLPGTEPEDAGAVADRLRHDLTELDPQLRLLTVTVPVAGIAEDVVLAAVRALAAASRTARPAPRPVRTRPPRDRVQAVS